MKILGIEHVAVAMNDSASSVAFLSEILGMKDRITEMVLDQQVLTDIYDTRQGKIELLTPLGTDSPISNFLERRGTGIHHIALRVDDIAGWLQHLKSRGVRLIDEQPRIGAEGCLIAFIHPKATGGILIELCQRP